MAEYPLVGFDTESKTMGFDVEANICNTVGSSEDDELVEVDSEATPVESVEKRPILEVCCCRVNNYGLLSLSTY